MPVDWQTAIYLFLIAVTSISVCGVIPWLVNKGFNALVAKMSQMESGITSLRVELQTERENRLVHYGDLQARIAEHRAICDERQRQGAHK